MNSSIAQERGGTTGTTPPLPLHSTEETEKTTFQNISFGSSNFQDKMQKADHAGKLPCIIGGRSLKALDFIKYFSPFRITFKQIESLP